MASKDKLLENAQKFLSKGQLPKAIGEYRKLVDAFPKDVRNRQKLAELLSRGKRNEDALTEYEIVAKHYTETGFYLKAIAVYKQMQKLESSRADIYHHLAELNEKQGLIGNALTEYRNLVAFYDQNQMYEKAIEVLEKMAELDPGNLNVLAKAAECYMATDQNDQALEKFHEVVGLLSAAKEHAKVIKLYDRFQDICPDDDKSRLPLADALVGSGSAEKAVPILQELLKQSPENQEINRCLAEAYVASKDFANARLTLKHLLKVNEGDLDLREYYVRVCLDFGEFERARDRLESWKDAFLQADRVAILKGFYEELKESLADDTVVAATLDAICDATGARPQRADTDASAAASSVADETADDAALEGVIDDIEELDMLGEEAFADIEVPFLDDEAPAEELQPEKIAAADVLLDLDLEVPVAEVEDATELSAEEEDVEIEIEIDLEDIEDLSLDFEDDPAGDDVAGEPMEEAAEFADSEPLEELEELAELDVIEELEVIEDAAPAAAGAPDDKPGFSDSINVEAELDEVEFYLQQGLYDDAARVVRTMLEYCPDLPELHAKMEEIDRGRQATEEESENAGFVDIMADLRDEELLATTDFLDSFGADGQVDEDLAQKTVSELDSADTESHFNLGIAYKEMGLYDDAIAEFEKASKDPLRAIDCVTLTGQCQGESGATELAMETFRQGLAMDNLNDEGRMGLNFEIGMLYQMNGQLVEALEIFQLVAEKDSFFRNVSDLIKNLRRELGLGGSDDDGPQGDRDRVSYV